MNEQGLTTAPTDHMAALVAVLQAARADGVTFAVNRDRKGNYQVRQTTEPRTVAVTVQTPAKAV